MLSDGDTQIVGQCRRPRRKALRRLPQIQPVPRLECTPAHLMAGHVMGVAQGNAPFVPGLLPHPAAGACPDVVSVDRPVRAARYETPQRPDPCQVCGVLVVSSLHQPRRRPIGGRQAPALPTQPALILRELVERPRARGAASTAPFLREGHCQAVTVS
jgi:hypothetical protein